MFGMIAVSYTHLGGGRLWCGERACEEHVKDEYGITTRCMPFELQNQAEGHVCACCGKPAKKMIYWARAY